MKHCSKLLLSIGLMASILLGMYPSTDTALCATTPNVSTLPAITAEISTPVRLATDTDGNIFVTDPSSGGILKYNNAVSTVQHIPTSKNGSGVAIAQNGDILVTQGAYVAVIDKTTYLEKARFGTFGYANGITVDLTGNIYVTDGRSNNIQKFGVAYNYLLSSSITLSRPAGIKYEKASNLLVVANSLAGKILFVKPADLTLDTTVGTSGAVGVFGYDSIQPHTVPKFIYPQGIAFEYDAGGALYRIYVSDSYQNIVQVLDGATKTWLADIGGYGFGGGKLYTPSDVLFDQSNPTNKRILVANGSGNIAVFGCDNMQPNNVWVGEPTINSLKVTWMNPTVTGFSFVRIYRSTVSNDPVPVRIADNLVGQNFIDASGLAPGTTYYYTVRAVDTSGIEFPTQPVSGITRINYNLALTTAGITDLTGRTGSGNISGPPSCSSASCPTNPVLDNTTVTLTAIANAVTSVFNGWTGYCDPAANNPGVAVNANQCTFTMTADRSVGAIFEPQSPFQVDGYLLDTLQEAHNTAEGNGSIIEAMSGVWPGSNLINKIMTADRPYMITVSGGFDSEFTAPTAGTTVITGRINLRSGKNIFKNIKIKP